MEYSEKIADRIEAYLKNQDWTYEFDAIHGTFSVEAELSCRLKTALIITQVQKDSFISYAGINAEAAPDCRIAVGEYLHRANYGLARGCFEMNYDDGGIHFKTFTDCAQAEPEERAIADSYIIPLAVIDHYGDGLLSLIEGEPSAAKRLISEADGKLKD